MPIFSEGLWPTLTDPRSSLYNPFWEPLLLGEMTFNVIVFAISLWLIYLFFRKHYLFSIVFVGFMLANLIFIPLDAWAATLIFPDDPMFDPETTKNMVRVAVSSAIWIPYMLLSRRVSQTFRSSA
ncbi:DUF2569 domain-containing protein [Marinobacter sp. NFXS9]|uniref:DUF2569 domain-containing protein n=1 Tax=Marinobacter sp. NFXS9 TaxID=2818433 RepID=UPI0032E0185E